MQTIRVAILGQGRSGRDIHGAYLSKDTERFRIVAVVDPLFERRERARRNTVARFMRTIRSCPGATISIWW